MDAVTRIVQAFTRPISARVSAMIGRLALQGIQEAHGHRRLQVIVRADEVRDNVEHFEPYGFTGYPEPGAEGILAHVGGVSGHPVVIVIADSRYRPKDLEEGEVGVYSKFGQLFKLDKDGNATLTAPGNIALVAGGNATVTAAGDVETDAGGENRVRSTARTVIECNGHGEAWNPTTKDTWTDDAAPGDHADIAAPRIP